MLKRRRRCEFWFLASLTALLLLSPLGHLQGNDRADDANLSRSYITARMRGEEVSPDHCAEEADLDPKPGSPPAHSASRPGSGGNPPPADVAALLRADLATMVHISPWIAERLSGGPDARYDGAMRIGQAVARWSRNNGLRAELVTALIWHESHFKPTASSPTNDHGLMQLHGRRIYDVDANVQAGCAHLAGNIKAAGGDEFRALCMYNGGPRGPGYPVCQRYARRVLETAAEVVLR